MNGPRLINVRGCNGSGKTHLLRSLVGRVPPHVEQYAVKDHKPIPVTYVELDLGEGLLAIVGDYSKPGCAGLDRVRTQAAAKEVIEVAAIVKDVRAVLFEGVLVATIFDPWLQWSRKMGGMTWAFLDTPIDVCLARIQARNGGTPIKEEQVRAKHRTIANVRRKAQLAGERVLDLPWELAEECLLGDIYGTVLRVSYEGC